LLEVGCAAGFLLDEARSLGWEVHGIDASRDMRAAARRSGLAVAEDVDDDGVDPGSVDLLILNQVLEHVADPPALLARLAPLVRRGGVVSIETWDSASLFARLMGGRWQQASPPSVLWLFTRRDLRILLRRHGFRPLQVRPAVKEVSVDTVIGQLTARAQRASGSRGARFDRVRRTGLPYALGDLVVALGIRSTTGVG
jgi:SAM-dependent methyltransferase